jgi:hypothetical protein
MKGKFGFWIQRQLTTLGIECLVVNPADIPKSQKDSLQKTDTFVVRSAYLSVNQFLLVQFYIEIHFSTQSLKYFYNGFKPGILYAVLNF